MPITRTWFFCGNGDETPRPGDGHDGPPFLWWGHYERMPGRTPRACGGPGRGDQEPAAADRAKRMAQSVLDRDPSFTIRGTAIYAALQPQVFERFAAAWRD